MTFSDTIKDWKLKLRYGKLKTPYQHYTVIAPVVIHHYIKDFDAKPGNAYIGVKVWVAEINDAADIVKSIGESTGFTITGRIEIFETEPVEQPSQNPRAYSINFTYYNE